VIPILRFLRFHFVLRFH